MHFRYLWFGPKSISHLCFKKWTSHVVSLVNQNTNLILSFKFFSIFLMELLIVTMCKNATLVLCATYRKQLVQRKYFVANEQDIEELSIRKIIIIDNIFYDVSLYHRWCL
jgi:hypothetical protein